MGVKKFIQSVQRTFNIELKKEDGKKKRLKELLQKLKQKRKKAKVKREKKQNIAAKNFLEEEIEIINLQIKKTQQMLKELKKNS